MAAARSSGGLELRTASAPMVVAKPYRQVLV
jgi:hypothetical protein